MLNEKVDNNTRAIATLSEKLNIIDKELDIRNVEKHSEYINMLSEINDSIDFLKHENLKNRQDLFSCALLLRKEYKIRLEYKAVQMYGLCL